MLLHRPILGIASPSGIPAHTWRYALPRSAPLKPRRVPYRAFIEGVERFVFRRVRYSAKKPVGSTLRNYIIEISHAQHECGQKRVFSASFAQAMIRSTPPSPLFAGIKPLFAVKCAVKIALHLSVLFPSETKHGINAVPNWLFLEILKYISILATGFLNPQMSRLILAIFFRIHHCFWAVF